MTQAIDISPDMAMRIGRVRSTDPRAANRVRLAFALACLLHVGFVGLFIYDDWKSDSRAAAAESSVDVDLVDESDLGGKSATGGAGGDKLKAPAGAEAAKQEQPALRADAPAEPATPSDEHPPEPKPPAAATPSAPETPSPAAPVEPPPPPASGSAPREPPAPAEQPAAAVAGAGARPPPRLPTFAMPNLLGATQAPTVGTALSEEYKGVVYGMLEKAKRDPDGPRPRPLSAVVTFDIDDAGNPRAIALARGSGRPDIDAEALALVRRAAPFPPPPPGVFRSFAPMIIFPAH